MLLGCLGKVELPTTRFQVARREEHDGRLDVCASMENHLHPIGRTARVSQLALGLAIRVLTCRAWLCFAKIIRTRKLALTSPDGKAGSVTADELCRVSTAIDSIVTGNFRYGLLRERGGCNASCSSTGTLSVIRLRVLQALRAYVSRRSLHGLVLLQAWVA